MQENQIEIHKNIGGRIVAGILDYIIICGITFYYIYTTGEPNNEGGYTVSGLPALVPILFWGIFTVGIEQWIGATLGNLLVGLQPISIRGNEKKIDFWTITKKTFTRSNRYVLFWSYWNCNYSKYRKASKSW